MRSLDAIQLDNLSKTYQRRGGDAIEAVKSVNLSIPAGQLFGFLGPNGAGKTTTIKMLCALVKPTSGAARVNGYDVWDKRGTAMRQIGAVLEGTRNVHWPPTSERAPTRLMRCDVPARSALPAQA